MPTITDIEGMQVSHVWRGYGSALFIELGRLSDNGYRKDGTKRNQIGEVSVMLDCGWRIEKKRSILLGFTDTNRKLEAAVNLLLGSTVLSSQTVGRLPELQISFSNSLWLSTFSTSNSQPDWALIFNKKYKGWLEVKNGKIQYVTKTPNT